MSSQRGGGRGRGSDRGDRSGSSSKGADRGGRGGFTGGGGRGDGGGGRGRGGPPGRGQSTQMATRGGPPGGGRGGIYGGPAPQPDAAITEKEDELVKFTRDRDFDGMPGRRGYGTKGKKIVLRTNYFKMNTANDGETENMKKQTFYRYEIDTGRSQLSRDKRKRLVQLIIKDARFNNKDWATDYANIIVTTEKLDLGTNNEWRETVVLPPPDATAQPDTEDPVPDFAQQARARNRVEFRVTYDDSFSLQHILDYLRSTSAGAEYTGRVDVIQLLNIIMCKPPQSQQTVANVGQNKFYRFEGHPGIEKFELGAGLQALRGYYASVRPVIGRLLVNINVTSGAFYKPLPLIDLINQAGFRNNEQLEAFLRMLKVKAYYKKDADSKPFMEKTKTIVGFAKQLNPPTFRVPRFGTADKVTFQYTDRNVPNAQPKQTKVVDYFRQEHGITLRRPDLPVLNVGTRSDPQYLPVELCTVLPGQPYRRILGGDQTSEMIKFAARAPNLNAISIAGDLQSPGRGVRLFRLADPPGQTNPQIDGINKFGVSVDTQMVVVPGRILDGPRVTYGANKNITPRLASWNLASVKFAVPGRIPRWQVVVLNLQGRGPRGNALFDNPQGGMLAPEALFNELGRTLTAYGLNMSQRAPTQTVSMEPLAIENRQSNDRRIREVYQKAEDQEVRFLFVVLPDVDKWLYARIKFYGDVEFGIHSINAVGSKLQKEKGQDMYMGNLALKFNIKGGGINHKVPNMFTKPLDNSTMLVGIDVTHPSPGSSEGAPSISSVVASTDEHLCQWPGSIRTQTGKEEMVSGLKEMVLERLDLWRKKHNSLPTKVIIYRDGVSEGQYNSVLQHELPSFHQAFKERYGAESKWPKVAIIIVGKRHHTRFYPTRQEDADYNPQREKGSWNCLPGTVVDRGIASRILREFWLQAHQGLQGTVRPAHYVVIKDDIAFEADQLEQFTHQMCYLFNRATKAVSICPPAYYADLLCERGRAYLYDTLAENHASDSSVFGANSGWTGGVHARLKDSTWYI